MSREPSKGSITADANLKECIKRLIAFFVKHHLRAIMESVKKVMNRAACNLWDMAYRKITEANIIWFLVDT